MCNAVILAAGRGKRLADAGETLPKCLLAFQGQSLLQRHLDCLSAIAVRKVTIVLGYQRHLVEEHIAHSDLPDNLEIVCLDNPDYERGSILSLWRGRSALAPTRDLLVMDADVLYDVRMLRLLIDSADANTLLIDRDFAEGDEPVKVGISDGHIVEFRKNAPGSFDVVGESVGFFRFSQEAASELFKITKGYIDAGRIDEPHEEAIRDLILSGRHSIGYADATGLPWIEIDFIEDIERARLHIWPKLSDIGRIE